MFIVETKGHRFWAYKVACENQDEALRRATSAFPDPVNAKFVASGSAEAADGHYDKACRKAVECEEKLRPKPVLGCNEKTAMAF
ncbi:MAG: hypothetical protein GZ088_09585 [Acidipila sp.]|nr:hypothetical protein [Acidipila sp.]